MPERRASELFWRRLWCSGLGSGYLKPAPGTWGSAAAVVIWWFYLAALPLWQQLLVVAVFTAISLYALREVVRESEVTDPSWIVVDEFAGQWLALLAAPKVLWVVLLGFALFRLFDITKPWIIGELDRRTTGARGVMADDLAAGLLAAAVLHIALLAIAAAGRELHP